MKSPFKFLDSYTLEDRDIFFGRDREIEELYHRVFESRIMLVYGISGTGKSSLIHCGLANKFRETDWLPVQVRRGGSIIESMAAGIKASAITGYEGTLRTPSDFRKAVRSLYLDHYKPVFFIFDQFEELFIFGSKEERKDFIQIVKLLTESDLQCRMIFVMREEYMAGVTEFEKYIPTFFSNRVRIEKMSHANAIEAIEKPCKFAGIGVEAGFAETLLTKLGQGQEDIELTYLQVFLDKIFDLAVQQENNLSPEFSTDLLEKTGNVSDLLGAFVDQQVSMMQDPESAMDVLKAFVSDKGTKRQANEQETLENIRSFGKRMSETEVSEFIQSFVRLRVLKDKDDNGRYELRHDALAAKIFEKFTLSEKELLVVRRFIENANFVYEKRGIHLTNQDLEYISAFQNRLILPDNLSSFVNSSREQILKRKVAMRRITRITAGIFVLILAFTLRFYLSTQDKSDPSYQYKSVILQSSKSPVSGLMAGINLWEQDSGSAELHGYILKDFQKLMKEQADSSSLLFDLQQKYKPVKLEHQIVRAWISRNGKHIYGWLKDGSVFIHNPNDSGVTRFSTNSEPVSIYLSEEHSIIATILSTGEVRVTDFTGKSLFTCRTVLNDRMNDKLVCFFNEGDRLLACAEGQNIRVYDYLGIVTDELEMQQGNINSIDISPDGMFLVAVAGSSGHLWHFKPENGKFGYYNNLSGHNGEVWSCRFNKTGKFIITASADSTIRIWDLNGNHINSRFGYSVTSNRYRLNNREPDEDRSSPVFAKYYGKFCDAVFSKTELEIIATGYADSGSSNDNINYYKVLFYDGIGGFPFSHERAYFLPVSGQLNYRELEFNDFVISPDNSAAALVDHTDTHIYLISGITYVLMQLEGKNPMFESTGRYLYWLNGNYIMKTPLNPSMIKQLVNVLWHEDVENEDKFISY